MSKPAPNTITVFEHENLCTNRGRQTISDAQLKSLQLFFKETDFPYYSLVHKGVRFYEYVGVIQVGNLTIEVLPKADNENDQHWRKMLIGMLRASGMLMVHAPSSAGLRLKSNSLLELYFELFIQEAESLLHKGLIKKYRQKEGNQMSLKGSLFFGKHIQQNLVHQERFYTKHTIYDKVHPLNCVLYKTIKLLNCINTNMQLQSRIGALMLNYPELPDIKADESFFAKLQYNHKTEPYKNAIDIAKLLLLNYHPDLLNGRDNVLALMFDMNFLWEKFVIVSLKRNCPEGYTIEGQSRKSFWKKENGNSKKMIPDIVITTKEKKKIVLDTKWKNLGSSSPSDHDLRQMYVHSKFHENAITALVYPGEDAIIKGYFHNELHNIVSDKCCSIIKVGVKNNIRDWQEHIQNQLINNVEKLIKEDIKKKPAKE